MTKLFSMKKAFTAFSLCLATLVGSVLLSACDNSEGGGDNGGGNGGDTTTTYTITLPEDNKIYTISSDKKTAAANEAVTLTIELSSVDYSIDSVKYNSSNCTRVNNSTYTFSMPERDVTISVTTTYHEEITSDTNASFRSTMPDKVAKGQEGDTNATETFYIDFETRVMNPTLTISSSNEDVIPVSALSYRDDSGESFVNYYYFTLDLLQVDIGVTYLTFSFSYSSFGTSSATLVKKLEVVEYGAIYDEDEIWDVSVTADLSSVSNIDFDIYLQVWDSNRQYGAVVGDPKSINTSDSTVLEFQYVEGREFSANAYYIDPDASYTGYVFLSISETSTSAGKYRDGALTFNSDGANLTLTITSST